MGTDRKTDRMESLHSSAESAELLRQKRNIRAIFWIAFLVGCATPEKPAETAGDSSDKPPAQTPKPLTQNPPTVSEEQWKQGLSKNGLNDRPTFSRDGKKVLFISRDRSLHRQRQLYEVNLETGEERRLTFQDGDVLEAVMSEDDDSIFYTSTTDQIKERPVLFYPEQRTSNWPPTDIYRMRPGLNIHERMTSTPSFDGFLHYHNDASGLLTASQLVGEDMHLRRTPTNKTAFETLTQKPGLLIHSFTSHGKRKWRAWVEEETNGACTIAISSKGQKPTMFKTGLLEVRDIQLIESSSSSLVKEAAEILLTGKTQKGQLRQAYWFKLKDNCLHPLMPAEATVADLRLSADQKSILWTMVSQNRSQIFLAPLTAPVSSCEQTN